MGKLLQPIIGNDDHGDNPYEMHIYKDTFDFHGITVDISIHEFDDNAGDVFYKFPEY